MRRVFDRINRVTALQVAGGLFCVALGALMLVTPQQFDSPAYAVLQAHLPAWGTLFLLAGSGLITTAALRPKRWIAIVVHIVAAAVLLLLAWGFIPAGALRASAAYTVLGLGVLLAPLIPNRKLSRARAADRDLFSLVVGIAATLIGAILLLEESRFGVAADLQRYLSWYGVAFIIGGLTLTATEFASSPPRWITLSARLLVACVFLAWMVSASWPNRTWTGILFYGGFGLLLALLPWLRPHLENTDPRSLRTRLALALVAIAALPLIAGTALVSEQQEQAVISQELASQQTLAGALAQDINDYVALHRSAVSALAGVPNLLELPADEQLELLRRFHAAYPDATSFSIFDAQGNSIARSDTRQRRSASDQLWFQQVRRTRESSTFVITSPIIDRPIFTFVEPLLAEDGSFLGVVAAALRSTSVATLLAETSGSVEGRAYLVNEYGQAIAHPDLGLVAALADLSMTAPVAALLASGSGFLTYESPDGEMLAGFDDVQEFGWGVVVERPVASALAPTLAGQELVFLLLLAGVAISVLIANFTAHRLAAPLAELANATRTLSLEGNSTPLPRTDVSEIAVLTDVFSQMRDRLIIQANERSVAEKERRESEERYRVVADTASDAMITIDERSTMMLLNPAAGKMFGYEPQHMIGRNLTMIMPEYLRHVHAAAVDRYLETGQKHLSWDAVELPGLHRSGREIPLEVSFGEYVKEGTRFFTSIIRDISDRKEAEEALVASNQRTVDILESINDVFYTLDHEWRFTYVNRFAEREWGLRREDLIGKSHWEVFPQAVDTEPYFELHKAAKERRTLQFEVFSPVVLKWIDVNVYPTHDGLSIYWRDITDRKRAEEQVQQLNVELEGRVQERTADLVAINQELEAFNYSVSHDLRTPLRGINGFSEALLEDYGKRLDDNGRRYLTRISTAAERMGDIIDDLLKLSRLSRSEMSFRRVNLGDLARRITDDLRAQDPLRSVTVAIADGMAVRADSTLIHIALENLLENAWKFTRKQEHACIEFGVVNEPEREVYFVRDNGAGFDMKYADKLFIAFQRLHTPAEYEGTGIGLTTVQRIIHRHGGRLWAQSEPDEGATFYFTLATKVETRES